MRRSVQHREVVGLVSEPRMHCDIPNSVLWTRVNFEEAWPGVLGPMSCWFYQRGVDRAMRDVYCRMLGVLPAGEQFSPIASVDQQLANVFYGRAVANVDQLRAIMNRIPGGDANALELQFLGSVRPGMQNRPTYKRVPFIVVRLLPALARLRRRLDRDRRETTAWWSRVTAPGYVSTVGQGVGLIREALDRYVAVGATQGLTIMLSNVAYDQLVKLGHIVDDVGLALRLSNSGAGTEETLMIADLWRASTGELRVETLVRRYGFHGPGEGELSGTSWREDDKPLRALLDRYRTAQRRDTIAVARASRVAAQAELLTKLPRHKRLAARAALRLADTMLPQREIGKRCVLQSLDGARAGVRAVGRLLVEQGVLRDPEDAFFLTPDEIDAEPGCTLQQLVDERRELHSSYLGFDIPDTFEGIPDKLTSDSDATTLRAGDVVSGLGASSGVVEGRARVVRAAADADLLQDGEILVCELTDPGWTPYFDVASGVVIDIGGPLSHGAVVARELGVPCVINTGNGTRLIPDGALLRVDGQAGTATILSTGSCPAP